MNQGDSLDEPFRKDLPFISCSKARREPVAGCLGLIQYDSEGLPENMVLDEEYQLFCAQFELKGREHPDESGKMQPVAEHQRKRSVYMNPRERPLDLQKLNTETRNECNRLEEMQKTGTLTDKKDAINRSFHCHTVHFSENVDQNGKASTRTEIKPREEKIKQSKTACGFFSSATYKADGSACEMLRIYKTRDEQEKYFEQMKDQMDSHAQDASGEDGKAGCGLILFVGLILNSYVRNAWSRDLELRKHLKTSYAVLDEMEKTRLYEYPDGTGKMTAFIGRQVDICDAYNAKVPLECLPSVDRKAEERKLMPKKRGRKPKDTPPPHKVVPVLIGV